MLALMIILHLSQVAASTYTCDPHFTIVNGMASCWTDPNTEYSCKLATCTERELKFYVVRYTYTLCGELTSVCFPPNNNMRPCLVSVKKLNFKECYHDSDRPDTVHPVAYHSYSNLNKISALNDNPGIWYDCPLINPANQIRITCSQSDCVMKKAQYSSRF
ncbi:hypothetical protein PGT21_034442 [Puccinia graminis f. sp. tritici]|uniref:Secreted protein n=1 Tax=Puccinia graminis f. sp. tritici TaxID=56615 RepID=A0A5B0N0X3_PUCGR|nr:hypothetical protein PGT21_034442 [Puccinia graminis f. sp. tritici]KAA1081780.1 hypothetical protein PGTUg99_006726 [Puccinia graminis f. sp. tritici]